MLFLSALFVGVFLLETLVGLIMLGVRNVRLAYAESRTAEPDR